MSANKISLSITLKVTGANATASQTGAINVVQTGSNWNQETQLIPTASSVALDINPGIAEGNLRYLMVSNMSTVIAGVELTASTYVDFATDEAMTNMIGRIYPAEHTALTPPDGTIAIYAKANVSDTEIVFLAIEA